MAQTTFTVDETYIGATIGPPDGYLVSLTMTKPPSVYEVPDANPATQQFTSGYFTLRGSRDTCNLYNAMTGHVSKFLIANHSLGYRGDLRVMGVPKGSVWELTLSDIPVAKGTHPVDEREAFIRGLLAQAAAKASAEAQPHGASTARKAGAILHAARTPT
jgi:hypothetical protein